MDLDQSSEMIVFESILSTFEVSSSFRQLSNIENWLELKIEPP